MNHKGSMPKLATHINIYWMSIHTLADTELFFYLVIISKYVMHLYVYLILSLIPLPALTSLFHTELDLHSTFPTL